MITKKKEKLVSAELLETRLRDAGILNDGERLCLESDVHDPIYTIRILQENKQ